MTGDQWVAFGWRAVEGFNYLVLSYFFLLNCSYLLLTLVAFRRLRRYALRLKTFDARSVLTDAGTPPVTLFCPAYNEETTCVESIRSLLTLEYPEYEILVVNDGSTDATMERLREAYGLERHARFPAAGIATAPVRDVWRSRHHPNLWVLDKANGGKSDALNVALNHCRTPFFCAVDADSVLEREALSRMVRPFLEDGDMIAAGAIIRLANGCTFRGGELVDVGLPRSWLARFQVLEYLRTFLSVRIGWDALDASMIISGAFGMFRRSAVVAAGGYSTTTVGEDMELIVRLHAHHRRRKEPYRIGFVPDPVAWTECPETLRGLSRQRDRWQRGLIEALTRHIGMLFNPRYGRIGCLAYPFFFFLEMLGPIVEVLGYLAFVVTVLAGRASPPYVMAFLLFAIVFGIVHSVSAVGLKELTFRRFPRLRDVILLFGIAVIENFGYRQLATFWRVRGTFSKLRRAAHWGESDRKGFQGADVVEPGMGAPEPVRGGPAGVGSADTVGD